MAERLFGVETEYAFTGLAPGGGPLSRTALVKDLLELAKKRLPHMADLFGGGLYLTNGARFYIDCGSHPEMGTPECPNPWDAVRYIQAGERILAGLAEELASRQPARTDVLFFRANVDYSGSGSTWGCHESYLHRANINALSGEVIPHLVSRVIYAGAGGFDPRSPGLVFTLSPRASHLERDVSNSSTSDRGIFHTKDEPLCGGGYHRMHILCGESLCSETASWLKVATTALVVAMIEAGVQPGRRVQLTSPVGALNVFASDPTCKAQVRLSSGERWTAIRLQRHYLEQAEALGNAEFMPPWAGEVCRRWRAMLDRLEGAPRSVEKTLDWAIKRVLYENRAQRHGVDWESLRYWTNALVALRAALDENEELRGKPASLDFLLDSNCPIRSEVERWTRFLRGMGLGWDGLTKFQRLRQELFEIDTRFGQLGAGGIFAGLEHAGVLDHHVDGVDNIEHAMAWPPAIGRARVRGEVIRRLAGADRNCRADWRQIVDQKEKRTLDLSDPFETQERWKEGSVKTPADRRSAADIDGPLSRSFLEILDTLAEEVE